MDKISTNMLDIKIVRFIDMCSLIISVTLKMRGHTVSVMITVNFNYMLLFGINSLKIMNKCDKSQQFLNSLSSKYLKNTLQNIIEPPNYTQNDSLALFPVHQPEMSRELLRLESFDRYPSENCPSLALFPVHQPEMSHEMFRLASFNRYPSENCPSLIRLAAAGFFYEGHGRKVKCFFCGITHDDWQSTSVPLEVHRVISPSCKYINERFPENKVQTSTTGELGTSPGLPLGFGDQSYDVLDSATNTVSQNVLQTSGCNVDAVHVGTDSSNKTKANLLVSSAVLFPVKNSTDSGFSGSLSFSGVSARSAPQSSSLTSSSRSSGYDSGYSSNQSAFSASGSEPSPSQLALISEERQQNVATRNFYREKYPEFILIERRRATYNNWPTNLNFLHPLDLSECGFFYSNFGDCVRCFHCGISLRNWETDDNPWVEHARWSRKCPYLLQRKGQEFIDSVLRVLGLQTDTEIEQQINNNGHEPSAQASSVYRTGSDLRDPIMHPSAQYVIKEKLFGDNKDRLVKKTMNRLLQIHDWDDITNDMLVSAVLEHKDDLEFMETEGNQEYLSEAKSLAPASKSSVEINETDENNTGQEMFTIEDVRGRSNVNIHVHNNYNVTGQNIIVGNGTIKDARETSEELTDIQIRLLMLEKKCGIHVCYIRKFSDMKREVSDSEGQRQFDFVCWYGYKIRVSAYIRCRALHFRFQVLASENDTSLQWPFRTRIVITILDQKDRTQNITAIDKSKTDIPSFSCPQASDASVYECNQVFPLDDFDSDRYVKEDDICIMLHIERQLL